MHLPTGTLTFKLGHSADSKMQCFISKSKVTISNALHFHCGSQLTLCIQCYNLLLLLEGKDKMNCSPKACTKGKAMGSMQSVFLHLG